MRGLRTAAIRIRLLDRRALRGKTGGGDGRSRGGVAKHADAGAPVVQAG